MPESGRKVKEKMQKEQGAVISGRWSVVRDEGSPSHCDKGAALDLIPAFVVLVVTVVFKKD
jgi:uncharacterized cupin superfamily protein